MYRYHSSQAFMVVALCSTLIAAASLVPRVGAAPTDVVDLEASNERNPPASTTDKSTPQPTTARESAGASANGVKERRDAAKEEAATERLKLRAGERVGDEPRGKAQVLGMALQEGTHKRVKVVDVTMNSPAFDAGVMKGDEIVAFQGFRGESYRKWIDGIQKLTTDTGPGLKIPVVVTRGGKQLTVGIEVPERIVRTAAPRALAQPVSPLIPPGVGPAVPAPGGPAGGTTMAVSGGNNVVIDGPFGDFFGGEEAASPNERAVAQIVRIGGQPAPDPAAVQSPPAGATAAPNNGGARIGMAGFRDDPSGMVVMVDVGALPPGTYTVGISDPSAVGGAVVTGAGAVNPNVQAPQQPEPQQAPAPASGSRPGVSQPQGSFPPASNKSIPRAILAQVADTDSSAPIDTIPAIGDATPASGEVNPSSSTPTGQSSVSSVQRPHDGSGADQNKSGTGFSGGMLSQIGTITVDQSGTGRMQQTVESAQVRNVVGQAIVIYSQGGSPRTLPANLNGNAGANTRQGVVDAPATAASQGADTNGGQNSAGSQTAIAGEAAAGSQVPVAAGIIQLVTDRRPPATTNPQTSQTPAGANEPVEQPASAAPPTGQNLVR